MKIRLQDTIVYTLTGKKHLYSLGDMAYGEWLIFKDNQPVYYLNIFDSIYSNVDDLVKNNVVAYLGNKFKNQQERYNIDLTIPGIKLKASDKWFDIEKLPPSFFEDGSH